MPMQSIRTRSGVKISYAVHGTSPGAPALVLVHGAFTDHWTNWEFVLPSLAQQFTVYAIARRGRGETDPAPMRRLEDEADDVVSLIRTIGTPVHLLGYSYGAHVALLAASAAYESVRKLILYEPPVAGLVRSHMGALEACAGKGDWSGMSYAFFREVLLVPAAELEALKQSELWPPIIADAQPTLADLRALDRYEFRPESFRDLRVPVMLQTGSESPSHLYATGSLAEVLPNCRIDILRGQAHEGMTTAPDQYVRSVTAYLQEALARAI